jgi:Ser/Thr protein kinase RdoA (MazF antagonist)
MNDAQQSEADYRSIIVGAYPELRGSAFSVVTQGWHSVAVDVDDRLIFKFPKNDVARAALLKEAALLRIVRPAVRLPVPDLFIHPGPPVFSRHEKLRGAYLLPDVYESLDEAARARLGAALGAFYRDLHRLDPDFMVSRGATQVEPWQSPGEIRRKAVPSLPQELRAWAAAALDAFERLPPDPYGLTYGFFDGHGWNMAFDTARARLNGVYDFADSGIGPVHQDFIYSNFIAPDLTRRIIAAYEGESGRQIDRQRVEILTSVHRLSELAQLAEDPDHAPAMIRHVAQWAAREGTFR